MSGEAMKVLELLEAGKITAEEAEKLLNAIDESPQKPKAQIPEPPQIPDIAEIEKNVEQVIEKVVRVVPQAVSSAMASIENQGEASYKFGSPEEISISIASGDLKLLSNPDGNAVIEVDGMHTIRDSSGTVALSVISGDAEIALPEKIKAKISLASGDMEIDSVKMTSLKLSLGTGDMEGEIAIENAAISIGSGDVDMEIQEFKNVALSIGSGEACLKIPRGTRIKMRVHENAEVSLPDEASVLEEEIVEKEKGKAKVRKMVVLIGDTADRELKLSVGHGDVEINI